MLSNQEFQNVLQLKQAANTLFSKHKYSQAALKYQDALDTFENKHSTESQLIEKVKIYSNLAQSFIHLKQWSEAMGAATAGLEMCGAVTVEHALEEKLRYRRACATRDGLPHTAGHVSLSIQDCFWLISRSEGEVHAEAQVILQKLELSAERCVQMRSLQQSLQLDRSVVARAAACGTYSVMVKLPSETQFKEVKPQHDHRSLLPGSKLRVKWYSPDCDPINIPHQEFQNDKLSGLAGTQEFNYYDPATMAIEFQCISTGAVDDFRTFDGGLLYLMGDAEYFWNAVLHYASNQTCAPPFSKSKNTVMKDWDQVLVFQEIE